MHAKCTLQAGKASLKCKEVTPSRGEPALEDIGWVFTYKLLFQDSDQIRSVTSFVEDLEVTTGSLPKKKKKKKIPSPDKVNLF